MPVFPSRDTHRPGGAVTPDAIIVPIGAQAPNAGKPSQGWSRGLLPLFSALVLGALVSCSHEPPEQALRSTIAAMQQAAEAHDTDALFEPIAEDFSGSEGMDRQAFRRYVVLTGMQNQKVGVQLGPLDVKLFDHRATVSFTAALSGGATWLPERAQVYQVETGWRLEDGDWKLISAKWEPRL
jgi:hypothetical protein